MPIIALLNQAGDKVRDLELNEAVFGIEPNQQVVYDVVNAQRAAMRQGTHDVKNRSEVRGGGKKPWRQKGTAALSYKVKNDKMIAVETFVFDSKKTKDFLKFLANIKAEGKTMVVCSRDEFDLNAICSARNVPNVVLVCCDNCSVYDMLCFDKLVITLKAVTYFEEALK